MSKQDNQSPEKPVTVGSFHSEKFAPKEVENWKNGLEKVPEVPSIPIIHLLHGKR